MNIYDQIIEGKAKLAVVGLGYVGMPLAVAFSRKCNVIGFDINSDKIAQYKNGIDMTSEVGDDVIATSTVQFTDNESELKHAKFFIVAVPTPVKADNTPDLYPVINASEIVGRSLSYGSYVVFESTVYPGVTEDVCIPILEKQSHLKCGTDFFVGYSPERISPADRVHRLENIKKIVSGVTDTARDEIAKVYELVIKAGVHKVSSIKTAEAAKVVENSQRDINIAFMNELAMVFDRMGVDTTEVIEAMNTKWNALHFYPGLVGGHCIGVDPYYFIYEAEKLGYHSQIVLSGRKVNDGMGAFVAQTIIKLLVQSGIVVKDARVLVMGITFKENCPDSRNTKVVDIVQTLQEYGVNPVVVDPIADPVTTEREYGIQLQHLEGNMQADCVVFAVAHNEFKQMNSSEIETLFKNIPNEKKVLVDIKSILNKSYFQEKGYTFWRL